MKLTRYLAIGVCVAAIATGANAQTLRQNPQPAEFPPASFSGSQYVDSNGCVFIRAGVNGAVTWVPRVSRDRRLICGAQPTQVATGPAAAPARTASAPVQIVPTAPVPQAAPSATVQAASTRVAAPRPVTSAPGVRAPLPTVATAIVRPAAPIVVTKPSSAPSPSGQVLHSLGGRCANASEFSNRWVNDGSRGPVRCGPQQLVQIAGHDGGGSIAAGGQRMVPARVYVKRVNTQNVVVPQGYVPVWDDDRLNPHRAEQTATGFRQTQEIWTNTVPRRLTNPAREPRIRDARIISSADAGVTRPAAPVVSTRSAPVEQPAPRAAAKAPAAGAIYVQVAMFGVAANAQATAQRLAGTGLPVRTGTLTRGGKSYQLVLSGPFASRDQAQQALVTARRLGFADAYIR